MKRNFILNLFFAFTFTLSIGLTCSAMPMKMSKEDMIRYTPEWRGKRTADGRPKVPDGIIERMKSVNIEEAWWVLRNEGYDYQFERGWKHIHPGGTVTTNAIDLALWDI